MRYMLLIYNNRDHLRSLTDAERDQALTEVDAIVAELIDSGEWIGGEALADASRGWTIRVSDGIAAITDGPFVEAKEQLAGYCLFEAAGLERALDIAARWPDAHYHGVELRPVMTGNGTEM